MCSYQVWVKRGCPDRLVQSATGQELLFLNLQTLYLQYIVLQSLPPLSGMFCSHDEAGGIRWSLGLAQTKRERMSAANPLDIF